MSRLTENAPESRHQVVRVSDDVHEVYYLQPARLGTIHRTENGWALEDGTTFDQHTDALRQLHKDYGFEFNEPASANRTVKTKVYKVKPNQRYMKLAGFAIDTKTAAYKDYVAFRTVNDSKAQKVVLEGAKSLDKDTKWIHLGETEYENEDGGDKDAQ